MPWEGRRESRGRYFTTTTRSNGSRTRHYFGSGPLGELAALLDTAEKVERKKQAAREKMHRDVLDQIEKPLRELFQAATTLFRTTMLTRGYYLHGRGEWRKRRV